MLVGAYYNSFRWKEKLSFVQNFNSYNINCLVHENYILDYVFEPNEHWNKRILNYGNLQLLFLSMDKKKI